MMKNVLIALPTWITDQLEQMRKQGTTTSGYIRCVLELEFADRRPSAHGEPRTRRRKRR